MPIFLCSPLAQLGSRAVSLKDSVSSTLKVGTGGFVFSRRSPSEGRGQCVVDSVSSTVKMGTGGFVFYSPLALLGRGQ